MKEQEEEIQEILEYYSKLPDRKDQAVIVEMLRELQEAEGCLTPNLKEKAAKAAEVPVSLIQLLVRRYPSLKEASYRHELIVCTGERCGKKGSLQFLTQLRKELRIQKNGLSADGTILLKTRSCLKQCRTSPNLLLDGQLYSGMSLEELRKLLQ